MRRRPGIAGIQQRRDASVALRVVGEDAERQHLEAMRAQQEAFFKAMTGGMMTGSSGPAKEDGDDLGEIKDQLAALQEKLSKMSK